MLANLLNIRHPISPVLSLPVHLVTIVYLVHIVHSAPSPKQLGKADTLFKNRSFSMEQKEQIELQYFQTENALKKAKIQLYECHDFNHHYATRTGSKIKQICQ